MGNVFGRQGRPSRVTDQDRAILQLKQQRDKLKQYRKKITLQLERERRLAKQLLKDGKRERALLLLKKKRYQDQLLDKTDIQIDNLERLVQDIEFAQIEIKVIESLKDGNDCLKQMHEQIDDLLAGCLKEEDEDAVLAELETLTQHFFLPPGQGEDTALSELPTDPPPAAPEGGTEIKTEREMLVA
ncbi:charged multivesicular body protein 6 isoform X3 [Danio rerio]|uniref:Charged multivesicular body protein 6 isoform X3 n=1 Tax=Danio rerio TaxID=7955 RepID=A0AB32TPN8_DANRE